MAESAASRAPAGPVLPERMRAARLDARGRVEIAEMPVPRPGPGEALVRLRACGICSSDLLDWYVAGKARGGPFVFGHEPAGEIVAFGPGTQPPPGLEVGSRVFVHHHAPCMACAACRRGDYVHCPVWRRPGLIPGGMAEYAVVAPQVLQHDTLPLPEGAGWEVGVLVEPVACAVHALRRAGFEPGWRVAVIGAGFMGQALGLVARAWGAAERAVVDRLPGRLAWAARRWATLVIDTGDEGRPGAVAGGAGGGPGMEPAATADGHAGERAAGNRGGGTPAGTGRAGTGPGAVAAATGGGGGGRATPVPWLRPGPGADAQAVARMLEDRWGEGADLVLVTPAGEEPLRLGIACARPGGTVVMFAPTAPGCDPAIPGYDVFFREIRLVPSYSAGPGDTRDALALLAAGQVPAAELVTHRYPLADVATAYRQVKDPAALKVMVEL
ncbi:Alcohol dehydrogenase GroES domain protein [Thermaerobacter marianensis DSM 12885]|uniref:Alcohol dehydrogenase GroES domain protein n=1 Tax=Thermaerobacter marianensis (strain ATCC 700841 / DSM 12885 / JCM 10246 / 7p75a) TaxID=644966 RepID=E6SGA2_THEM7|nr:alcohol dehydrogenase catalytic domain-containing protein [Thermaerobacter marianensis]ADU50519.1 Alcohol dehydrogenase GroES domain protein [Thermaerobacter marianensis DSM 12885]